MPTIGGQTAGQKDAEPNVGYVAFHKPRFSFVVALLRPYVKDCVLDVGRSQLTSMIARELGVRVDSLGLEPDEELSTGRHYCIDLNEPQNEPRGLGRYDAVVFAEVIEHLHTAPEAALAFLRKLLLPGGALILQTPNAVSLGKRVKMALGINPFERLRADKLNPGHYREYTLDELIGFLVGAGFSVERTFRRYYFDARFARHEAGNEEPARISGALRNLVYRALPPALREGITIVARRN
jgi:SAM-dependent methyltransferase